MTNDSSLDETAETHTQPMSETNRQDKNAGNVAYLPDRRLIMFRSERMTP